jgi:hypothetical protein
MRTGFRAPLLAVVTLAVAFGVLPGNAQAPYRAPRTADGKANLNGIWQALNEGEWDIEGHSAGPGRVLQLGAEDAVVPGLGIVEGGPLPYLPAAAAKKKANFEKRLTLDPEIKCYLPGVPRAMYMPYKFQIIQGTNKIMMVFEFNGAERTIHLDEVQPYPADAYMGHSVAHWEGDTLVVDVTRFTAQTWLDRAGDFHSDALHVVERYTPITRDAFQYEATLEDPNVFTRPWKIRLPIYRRLEPNAQLMEFRCPEMAEETVLGHLRKEQLVKTWEGKTMRVDITRKIPPGDAVYERHVDGNPPPR